MLAIDLKERLLDLTLHLSNVIGPRAAASRADDRALRLIREGFEGAGLEPRIEEFPFTGYEAEYWRLSVDGLEFPSVPCVASLPARDLAPAPVVDVGYGTEEELGNVKDRIILARVGRIHESFKAEKAAERGAVGMILFLEDDPWGIYTGRLRYPLGSIPAIAVSRADGLRLSRASAAGDLKARIEIDAHTWEARGKNLLATLRGRGEEFLAATAHRDSRPQSPGANDNASGSVVLLELARALSGQRPDRSIVFFSTDAEEYGLRGSLGYVEAHRDGMNRCVANLNLDSVGQGGVVVMERDRAGLLSEPLNRLVVDVARGRGLEVGQRSSQNGSDCDAFMAAGVPAAWIRGWPSTSFNSTTDTFDKLDYELMARIVGLGSAVLVGLSDPGKWVRPAASS